MVQVDETYRTNVHGAGMLHVVCSFNTNVTYTLGYGFMQSATGKYLQWILEIFVEYAIIINPSVFVTDIDKELMNLCAGVFSTAHNLLFTGIYNTNQGSSYHRFFRS